MIVVVGGQARKVGKTKAMCDIISATKSLAWTAVKLTAHSHGAPHPDRPTDTGRYLAAGATTAMLLHSAAEIPAGGNVIVESNHAAECLRPDLFVFVTDSSNPEWKDSARRVFHTATIVVERELSPATLGRIAAFLLSRRAASE